MALRLYVDFSDVQGQITPWSMMGSCRKTTSYKHCCMSSFPAEVKKYQIKMKSLKWQQHISHCKYMGIFSDVQGQLTPQSVVGSGQNSTSVKTL